MSDLPSSSRFPEFHPGSPRLWEKVVEHAPARDALVLWVHHSLIGVTLDEKVGLSPVFFLLLTRVCPLFFPLLGFLSLLFDLFTIKVTLG